MAIIFWLISIFIPPLMGDLTLPGIEVSAGALVGTITLVFTAIFLIRALADGLVLSDIVTDILIRRLGIKEERSPRRAARDAIYIIVIILLTTALQPIISALDPNINDLLSKITIYVGLALILILIYDIGRILYKVVERKAESMADSIARMTNRQKNRE